MNKLTAKIRVFLISILALMAFYAPGASAGIYDTLTAAVSFTDLTAAMGIVYAGLVVVGIFMLGADIITKKLGWKK